MKFPLRHDLTVDVIVDDNGKPIVELSDGCRADMEYLVLAANEKFHRDNPQQDRIEQDYQQIEEGW